MVRMECTRRPACFSKRRCAVPIRYIRRQAGELSAFVSRCPTGTTGLPFTCLLTHRSSCSGLGAIVLGMRRHRVRSGQGRRRSPHAEVMSSRLRAPDFPAWVIGAANGGHQVAPAGKSFPLWPGKLGAWKLVADGLKLVARKELR